MPNGSALFVPPPSVPTQPGVLGYIVTATPVVGSYSGAAPPTLTKNVGPLVGGVAFDYDAADPAALKPGVNYTFSVTVKGDQGNSIPVVSQAQTVPSGSSES